MDAAQTQTEIMSKLKARSKNANPWRKVISAIMAKSTDIVGTQTARVNNRRMDPSNDPFGPLTQQQADDHSRSPRNGFGAKYEKVEVRC